MLKERTRLYLLQILDAVNKIEATTTGLDRTAYDDHEVKWVVERGI